mmetsp:Transcript_31681/g.67332  ORF Transcript_31681/g.67332 Transcript_31681/m.67332 type:complete len:355 (+) Transcript_31681:70-1134(+)
MEFGHSPRAAAAVPEAMTPLRSPLPLALPVQSRSTPGGSRLASKKECLQYETPGRTPRRGGAVSIGPCTPQRSTPDCKRLPSWPSRSFSMETPEAKKRSINTPPSGPMMLQKRLEDDIEAALLRGSLSLLSLALLRGHCCGQDHCVHEAVRRQNVRALEFLLQRDVQDVDAHCCGRRPLHLAIQACMVEGDAGYKMAELLLQHAARPNLQCGDDWSVDAPLHEATKRGCAAAVALLLRYGADPNAADMNSYTPLHVACRQTPFQFGTHHGEVVQLLLRHGAVPYHTDLFGLAPLQYAHDGSLRRRLIQAEQAWSRRALALARGRSCVGGGQGEDEARIICCSIHELFEAIIHFL